MQMSAEFNGRFRSPEKAHPEWSLNFPKGDKKTPMPESCLQKHFRLKNLSKHLWRNLVFDKAAD